MDTSSPRLRNPPGALSTIDRQNNLLLQLSNQSGSTAYQFRETKLLFRSKVEPTPEEFRPNKKSAIRVGRDVRQNPPKIGFVVWTCGLSLSGANQWCLGHFQNLPRAQRGRTSFRLVLRNASEGRPSRSNCGTRRSRAVNQLSSQRPVRGSTSDRHTSSHDQDCY
jgi:hypothetical protein